MKNTRIVTDGKRFWIQRRILWMWHTLSGYHDTLADAQDIADRCWGHESEKLKVVEDDNR